MRAVAMRMIPSASPASVPSPGTRPRRRCMAWRASSSSSFTSPASGTSAGTRPSRRLASVIVLHAPAPVTGRARRGAGAPGPDPERLAGIEPGQAPAACPDGVDLDLRGPVGKPGDVPFGREGGLQLVDETDIGARSTHVAGDQVPQPGDPP